MATKIENLEGIIEAVLFTYGEGLSLKKIAGLVDQNPAAVATALNSLKNNLSSRGLKLIDYNGFWQLVSDKAAAPFIQKLVRSEIREEITPAGLEILAITAYHGPVTKAQIESIRGVNSSYALRNLTLRGLIEKTNHDIVKKTGQYQISLAALRKLGLTKIEELPQYHQLKTETTKIEALLTGEK